MGIERRGIGDRAELPGLCAGPPLHDCPGWPAATRTGPNVRPPGHCQGIEVATQPFAAAYRPDHPEQFACSANSFAIEIPPRSLDPFGARPRRREIESALSVVAKRSASDWSVAPGNSGLRNCSTSSRVRAPRGSSTGIRIESSHQCHPRGLFASQRTGEVPGKGVEVPLDGAHAPGRSQNRFLARIPML